MNPEQTKKLMNLPLTDDFCCKLKFNTLLPSALPGPKLLFPPSQTHKLTEAHITHLNTLTKPEIYLPMTMNINIEQLHLISHRANDGDLDLNSEEEEILEIPRKKPARNLISNDKHDGLQVKEKLEEDLIKRTTDENHNSSDNNHYAPDNESTGVGKAMTLRSNKKLTVDAFLLDEDAIRDKKSFREKVKQNLQALLNSSFSENQAISQASHKNVAEIFPIEQSEHQWSKDKNMVECVFYKRAAFQKNNLPNFALVTKNDTNQKVLSLFNNKSGQNGEYVKYKETTALVAAISDKRNYLSDINCLYIDQDKTNTKTFKVFEIYNSIYATKENKNFEPLTLKSDKGQLTEEASEKNLYQKKEALEEVQAKSEAHQISGDASSHSQNNKMELESEDSLDQLLDEE